MSRTLKTAAVLAALSLTVAGCANKSDEGGSGGGCNKVIAYAGAMSGPNAQLGINEYNGGQLAVNQYNEKHSDCKVQFKKFDTEGDPNKAPGVVTQLVNDQNIIGVLGLPFSGESKATGKIFEQAGLVHITASATNPSLTTNGWKTFFRGLGNDNVQGPAVKALADKQGFKKVFVVQDDSDYGVGLAATATKALGGMVTGSDKVTTNQKDFSATVQKVLDSKADAVFYSGYYAEGAPFDSQLVAKGYKGAFIGPDGVKDPEFIKQAGSASTNAYFTCPCIPGDTLKDFATAYKTVANSAPGTYSVEAYDATNVLLDGVSKGNTSRSKLLSYVKGADFKGLAKQYKWNDKGELTDAAVYGYKVDNGQIVSIGKL
ncbi:branched-chain amino acid ABC transporter substrate-binding protein [Calidifontibacter indicus]|uniref:Amino acid/amide ABC transporter substrate-binding protein (HAAT family) n=1 Tax=Calidifontibacter indicus TaxID=419650 RepID=A0A3D9UNI7_9MICO|nr:branched-chain amino acid ABC transporter substrate-binding protein [Calidifontibacter indicus]REF31018.1 amino acid/amide ABC transporter substrate-binding protein (HAAT family) [Calidifontibacter indicus]